MPKAARCLRDEEGVGTCTLQGWQGMYARLWFRLPHGRTLLPLSLLVVLFGFTNAEALKKNLMRLEQTTGTCCWCRGTYT
eukprot:348106-Amphidinium_carterae.1